MVGRGVAAGRRGYFSPTHCAANTALVAALHRAVELLWEWIGGGLRTGQEQNNEEKRYSFPPLHLLTATRSQCSRGFECCFSIQPVCCEPVDTLSQATCGSDPLS